MMSFLFFFFITNWVRFLTGFRPTSFPEIYHFLAPSISSSNRHFTVHSKSILLCSMESPDSSRKIKKSYSSELSRVRHINKHMGTDMRDIHYNDTRLITVYQTVDEIKLVHRLQKSNVSIHDLKAERFLKNLRSTTVDCDDLFKVFDN